MEKLLSKLEELADKPIKSIHSTYGELTNVIAYSTGASSSLVVGTHALIAYLYHTGSGNAILTATFTMGIEGYIEIPLLISSGLYIFGHEFYRINTNRKVE